MTAITIDYVNSEGIFTAATNLSHTIWVRVRQAALENYPEARIDDVAVKLPWANALGLVRELEPLQRNLGFKLTTTDAAKPYVARFVNEIKRSRAILSNEPRPLRSHDSITSELISLGFTKRQLKSYQLNNLQKILSLQHGANFSVPGAGKTTVTFATHLLQRELAPNLIVVAPLNAFTAWDEVIHDCIGDDADSWTKKPFTRLTGNCNVKALINSGEQRFIINYEKLDGERSAIEAFMIMNKTHLVLDESHRIKNGVSQRGAASLRLSPFAERRDILSGTPAPHNLNDLTPQLNFLWPGTGLSKSVLGSKNPQIQLNNLYARTTKKDLDIPERKINFHKVEMSAPQLALYALLKSEFLRQYCAQKIGGNYNPFRTRGNAIRLLQVTTNPAAAAEKIYEFIPSSDQAANIIKCVIQAGNSPKIMKACEMARELAAQDKKVIIWSIHRDTISRLSEELKDIGVIELHGGIKTGDVSDPTTRENAIKRFHDDKSIYVAIANPAACSEGISLHKVCHEAIYLDRSYNAAHYLQSIDRIHRLGIDKNTETNIHILQSVAPTRLGSVDHSVSRRLALKIRTMYQVLEDPDLHEIALDEEEADIPTDNSISLEDLQDLIEQLRLEDSGSSESLPDDAYLA